MGELCRVCLRVLSLRVLSLRVLSLRATQVPTENLKSRRESLHSNRELGMLSKENGDGVR